MTKTTRVIQIFSHDDRHRLLAVRRATSLRDALKDYFEETLKPASYSKPLYNGNVLTVTDQNGLNVKYNAKDVS